MSLDREATAWKSGDRSTFTRENPSRTFTGLGVGAAIAPIPAEYRVR